MNCHSGKRYISYFEILEFNAWVKNIGSTNAFEYVKNYLSLTIESSLPNAKVNEDLTVDYRISNVDFLQFSNTIVFYTIDESYESFKSIVKTSTEFINVILTGLSLTMKGSISYGDFFVDDETNSFVGQALVDAYLLTKKLDWLALCIDPRLNKTKNVRSIKAENPELIKTSPNTFINSTIKPEVINWADKSYLKDISFNAVRGLEDAVLRRQNELKYFPERLKVIESLIDNTKTIISNF